MADKDFKVKSGLDISVPLPVSMGGTGQTSTTNTLNSLLPSQPGNDNKYLQTNGVTTQWNTITVSNIPNSALTNSSITINGSAVSLGGSITISASGDSDQIVLSSQVFG